MCVVKRSVDKNKLEETDTVNENNFAANDANKIQQFLEDFNKIKEKSESSNKSDNLEMRQINGFDVNVDEANGNDKPTVTLNRSICKKTQGKNLNAKLKTWFVKHRPSRRCAEDLLKILKEENLDVNQFYGNETVSKKET